MSDKKQPPVAIIIPHYKNKEDTLRCVKSFISCDYPDFSLFLIDLSDDLGEEEVQIEGLNIIIEKSENNGFGAACNFGVRKALTEGFEYFLTLNNDTVVKKNFLQPLVTSALLSPQSIFAPVIIDGNTGSIEVLAQKFSEASIKVYPSYPSNDIRLLNSLIQDNVNVVSTDVHCGCALFFTLNQFKELEGFNEDYFLYCEDIDLSFRALKLGYTLKISTESHIEHYHGGSSGGHQSKTNIYYNSRNRITIAKKYLQLNRKLKFLLVFPLLQGVKMFIWLLKGNLSDCLILLSALSDAIMGKNGINPKIDNT
ncbi:MAG: glycosyltransferase family 2 protein [Nitrospinae bacterium]|nr:glycosyltransferase family 2 protein [Nitrospinota bacterium]